MNDKVDMLLLLLLEELLPEMGTVFYNEDGVCENFEVVTELLRDEDLKDGFYQVIEDQLQLSIDQYMDKLDCKGGLNER